MATLNIRTLLIQAVAGAALCAGFVAPVSAQSTETLRIGQAMQSASALSTAVVTSLGERIRERSDGSLDLKSSAPYANAAQALQALERGELDLAFIRLADAPSQFPHHWVVAELGRLGDPGVSGMLHQKLVDRGVLCGYGLYQVIAAGTAPSDRQGSAEGVAVLMNQDRFDALNEAQQDVLSGFDTGWLPGQIVSTMTAPPVAQTVAWQSMVSRHPAGRMIDRVIAESFSGMSKAE